MTTAYPLEWHLHNLVNRRAHLESRLAELDRLQSSVAQLQAGIAHLENQLAVAKLRGLTAFDPERFLKPKKAEIK